MADFSYDVHRTFTVILKLSEDEGRELRNSIGEASNSVTNWRSDPVVLHSLRDWLTTMLAARGKP